jgi:hypothetical protein
MHRKHASPEVLAAVERAAAHPDWPQHCYDEWAAFWEDAAKDIPKRRGEDHTLGSRARPLC